MTIQIIILAITLALVVIWNSSLLSDLKNKKEIIKRLEENLSATSKKKEEAEQSYAYYSGVRAKLEIELRQTKEKEEILNRQLSNALSDNYKNQHAEEVSAHNKTKKRLEDALKEIGEKENQLSEYETLKVYLNDMGYSIKKGSLFFHLQN